MMEIKYFKLLTILVVCFVVSGCSSSVRFYEFAEQSLDDPKINKIRVHIDAFGNIYPHEKGIASFAQNGDSHSVLDQFYSNKKLCETVDRTTSPFIYEHCDELKSNGEYGWDRAQQKLWQETGISIAEKAKNKDIVFLIHGFNTNGQEAIDNFDILKKKIGLAVPSKDIFYVEIFWDGFQGGPITGAWSKAQSSGPLVGFHMRQLFNGMINEYNRSKRNLPQFTILTHSSGAFVAGALLGDPSSALKDLRNPPPISAKYQLFKQHRADKTGRYAVPNIPNIRLAMIAAATPWNTFTGYSKNGERIVDGILSPSTQLIFTLNYKDTALQKYLHLASLNLLGATNAGANSRIYCNRLQTVKNVKSIAFDFSDGGFLIWNSHGVDGYMSRENANDFISAALGETASNEYKCP